ncbi:hypothetical protein [Haliangium ochraceum]|uniref:Uncharacterized protein n=1 Tax=Haliangium ochraceum (strain DSM 14365 / JCM 11303 / SMP-2) TaxID=502025 RepID=D0LW14_HALO1|nr:hypothetical protein [Haliangium ochraceum]ACY14148.1 hypothetical protein Hoch_1598 [Haliangium ochraceum DSM 14365]
MSKTGQLYERNHNAREWSLGFAVLGALGFLSSFLAVALGWVDLSGYVLGVCISLACSVLALWAGYRQALWERDRSRRQRELVILASKGPSLVH